MHEVLTNAVRFQITPVLAHKCHGNSATCMKFANLQLLTMTPMAAAMLVWQACKFGSQQLLNKTHVAR